MLPGDVQLFLVGVAAQLDDLHAVEQRTGYGGRGVGSSNEHHAAQVHGQLDEMVAESPVLLTIQYLQQGRSRVAPHIAGQLVDLIQHQQRVHGTGAGQGLDNAAGHSADIRLAVAADIRLVPHAAQTQPGALAVHGLGHGQSHGGLAHTGRPHQAEYPALGVRVQLPHGDKLQNALLDLIQAVVVLIQYLSGLRHIRPLPGEFVPGQLQTHIQIVAYHRGLGAAEGLLAQALHLFCQLGMYLLRQVRRLYPGGVLLQFLVAVIPQLVLQYLHLLPQDHVLLYLGHTAAYLLLHFALQRDDVHLMGQDIVDDTQALIRVQLLQHPLAVLVPQGDILGDQVGQTAGITAIQHRGGEVFADAVGQLAVFTEEHIGSAYQRLAAGRMAGRHLGQQLGLGLQKRLFLPQAVQPCPALTLRDDTHRSVRGLDDLQNMTHRADGVQILLSRLRRGQVLLRHRQQPAVILHGVVQSEDGDIALRVKGHRLPGESRQAAQCQHRNVPGDRFHSCLLSPAGRRALGKG